MDSNRPQDGTGNGGGHGDSGLPWDNSGQGGATGGDPYGSPGQQDQSGYGYQGQDPYSQGGGQDPYGQGLSLIHI